MKTIGYTVRNMYFANSAPVWLRGVKNTEIRVIAVAVVDDVEQVSQVLTRFACGHKNRFTAEVARWKRSDF